MTINTNGEGVAVCRCGSELHVVCSSGCPEPDVVFKSELAAMRKPRPEKRKIERAVKQPPPRKPVPDHCTYGTCTDPVAPRVPGAMGRPVTRCAKHLELFREKKRKAESNGATP